MSAREISSRRVVTKFAQEYMEKPYLCYTEHGLHALLFTRLYDAVPYDEAQATWRGQHVSVIQKEYPTAKPHGRSRRQHWDIAVLQLPLEPVPGCNALPYDCLKVAVAIELGLNATLEHLQDDIERLSLAIADESVGQGYLIHLYRLSDRTSEISSRRDWRPTSGCIVRLEMAAAATEDTHIEVLYGLYNEARNDASGLWLIRKGRYVPVQKAFSERRS